MHLILTGATGLVGTAVLHHILSLPATSPLAQKITRLSVISRRDVPLLEHADRPKQNTFTKVEVIHNSDFKDYDRNSVLDKLKSAADNEKVGVIWALGVSQTLVSEDKYKEITHLYPTEAAKAFATGLDAKQVNFVYISGEGATTKPGFMTPLFGRVKGQTELDLIKLMQTEPYSRVLKCFSARPGGVDAGAESDQKLVYELTHAADGGTGAATRNSMGMKVGETLLLPILRAGAFKGMHSPTSELARVLVELATSDGDAVNVKDTESDGRIIPNIALRRLGGSVK